MVSLRFPVQALLALGALLASGVLLLGCTPEAPAPVEDNPLAEARYVGDASCASCHADLYASYHTTGMGRAVSRFDPVTAPERFDAAGRSPVVCHEPSGYCYQAFVRGDTLFQREFRPDTPGFERVHAASHVVGSGNATRSYLMTVSADGAPEAGAADGGPDGGGYVTEMPLTWYVERAIWDLSPGYTQTNDRFGRPIVLHCMTCHNGFPGFEDGPQNFYTDVPLGITCERCHGPGSAHVDARLVDQGDGVGPDPTIVNPAHLGADLQLAVCQQCHLEGLAVFAPGEDPTTYRPGTALDAHRAVYARAEQIEDPEAFGIASHAIRMMQSACFEATRGTANAMTCTTCHDPHQPNDALGPDHFNDACRSCHGGATHEVVCTRPAVDDFAEAVTGDCVGCHMRRGGTSDIPHVTFTDHWIRRTVPPARPPEAIERGGVRTTPFRLVDVTQRERVLAGVGASARSDAEVALAEGIAYWRLYEVEHRLPAYLPTIAATIRRGLAGGADRPDAHFALGRALAEMDSVAAAETVLAEAAARWPESVDLLYWLGDVRVRQGRPAAALEPLEAAVAQSPHFTEARLKLAEARAEAGRAEEAVRAYREALRRDPARHAEGWNNLGFLLLQLGRTDEAEAALRRSLALTPTSAEARANLGATLLGRGDLDGAAAQFEAALRYRPDYVPALGNLGVVRMRQGRTDDARRLFRRVLDRSPNDPQAAAYLQQLDSP